MTTTSACQAEILELHQFFEDWFAGRLEPSATAFERCRRVLPPDFTLINPDGVRTDQPELLERLQSAHGSARDTYFHIRIDEVSSRPLGADLHLVTYQEWQDTDEFVTARWSTAIMKEDAEAPNGLVWLHVQETWIATDAD